MKPHYAAQKERHVPAPSGNNHFWRQDSASMQTHLHRCTNCVSTLSDLPAQSQKFPSFIMAAFCRRFSTPGAAEGSCWHLTLQRGPAPLPHRALLPRCACGAGAVQLLGIFGDPPGGNCNHQEASRREQTLPRSLWDLLAITRENLGRQVVCLQLRVSGVPWAVWVGTSWDGSRVFDC